jgi:hypothetical protein
MPSGYHRDYANAVSNIYQNMGQAQANARLQQGQGWANAFGQIGQTVAAIPGQMQANKDAEAQRQRMALQDARLATQDRLAQTELEEKMFLRNAIASSMGPDGRVDHARLQENLQKMGAGHIAAEATQAWQQMETGWLNLQHGVTQGIADQAALGKLRDDYFGPAAVRWMQAEPGLERDNILGAALFHLETKGLTQQAEELRTLAKEDPQVFQVALEELAARYRPRPNLTNVPQGSVVFNEDTLQPVYTNPKPEEPLTLTQQFAAAKTNEERARVAQLIRQEAQAKHIAPAPSTTRYQRADVTLPDGTTALANFDSQTGKYTDVDTGQVLSGVTGAPTAEQRNKASARKDAVGLINMLREMSDRIIKRVGPAQRADAARRGVAAVFGADPEFKVYQDLRYSLALNLAVMQQGSRPTDPDVQKGALPLVPDPFSDTDDSATMKWAYVDTLIDPKKAGNNQAGGQTGPVSVTIGTQTFVFPTQAAADAFRRQAGGG